MFSENLKKLLLEKDLTQSDLAAKLNTSRQNVYQWISGKTTPRNPMLQEIAKVLGVTLSKLLDESQEPEGNKTKSKNIETFGNKENRKNLSLREILTSNVKFYRKQTGMTQADFAKAIGTDPVYISYIENGQRFPSVDFIEKMAEILDIDSYRLFIPRNLNNDKITNTALYQNLKIELMKALDTVFNE